MTIYMPERGWTLYLSCLEKPRSLKEVSRELGYRGQAAFSNRHKGKPLVEWMMDNGFLEFAGKSGRETRYSSCIERFFVEDLWKKDWVRSSIFKLSNIKALYEFGTERTRILERLGGEFVRFIASYNIILDTEIFLEEKAKESKLISKKDIRDSFFIRQLHSILSMSHANLNTEDYISKIRPAIDEHKDDFKQMLRNDIMEMELKKYNEKIRLEKIRLEKK